MQCIWFFKCFNPCPHQPLSSPTLTTTSLGTSSSTLHHHTKVQDYTSIYRKKSRCQPDELNNRNKWRKFARSYALTKSLIIVEIGPKAVTNTGLSYCCVHGRHKIRQMCNPRSITLHEKHMSHSLFRNLLTQGFSYRMFWLSPPP